MSETDKTLAGMPDEWGFKDDAETLRIECLAIEDGGTIVQTHNNLPKNASNARIGRALGAIIRNAWMMAQDIDCERGPFGFPSVIESIINDWQEDAEEVCLRCGEDMQEDREPACSRCGSLDIYRDPAIAKATGGEG